MQTEETISSRRTVKHFDVAHQMSNDEIKKLLSSASLSPTAFNIPNRRFAVVSDHVLRTDPAQSDTAFAALPKEQKKTGLNPTSYCRMSVSSKIHLAEHQKSDNFFTLCKSLP